VSGVDIFDGLDGEHVQVLQRTRALFRVTQLTDRASVFVEFFEVGIDGRASNTVHFLDQPIKMSFDPTVFTERSARWTSRRSFVAQSTNILADLRQVLG
jgi:hypothetical protein